MIINFSVILCKLLSTLDNY